ncbi:MAG: amidase [Ilumatobacter sp.]|nr:amidase [Ilumatobacter sp.]
MGDLAALSGRLQRREVSPVELANDVLDRIEAENSRLKAFVGVTRERALAEAAQAERELAAGESRGPLHGIPYAVKDLFDVADEATGAGSHLLADNAATADAEVVRRLSDAGMVLVGKTHTVQFAFGGAGINHDTATPHNPRKTDHYVPGGSSSGSAVAVAAGLVPLALGSDTSGSVRIPASLCGITGLKTTVGQISRNGVYPLSPTLDSVGPLTRTATDSAIAFAAMRDATAPAAAAQHDRSDPSDLSGMRLAFVETFFFDDADPAVVAAVRAAGDVLAELGAEVTSIGAPELNEVLAGLRARTVQAEGYAINRTFLEQHFDELDPVVAHRMADGRELAAIDFVEAFEAWKRIGRTFAERTAGIDAWLAPATMIPAKPVAEVDADLDTYLRINGQYLRNTSIGNRLEWCGLSVPCGDSDGLPIGLMIQAPPNHEQVVLRIGAAYQHATDWHRLSPARGG